MKALFVYSVDDVQSVRRPLPSWAYIQFGISYISSVLTASGHETQLVVLGSNARRARTNGVMETSVESFDPPLLCFTATHSQYPFIESVARRIRSRWPEKLLVIGGPHATLNPDQVIQDCFDAVCIGEGEFPTLEFCDQLDSGVIPSGIPNWWIKRSDGTVERNRPRPFLQEIDALPFPDRTMWLPWIKLRSADQMSVLLARGCPYSCTYCCHHALRRISDGRYVRMRDPEKIIREISWLYQNFRHPRIHLEMETIALDHNWLLELCAWLEAYNRTIDNAISYSCNFRVDTHVEDGGVFTAMRRANITSMGIGLESGSPDIRKDVLNRHYSNEDFVEVVRMASEKGIEVRTYNMIGLPGESLSDHMQTVALNRHCQPATLSTSIFFPYAGTELYERCIREGLIKGRPEVRLERRQAVLDLPDFRRKQIQSAYTWFYYRVYRGHRPLWLCLLQVLAVKLRSNATMTFLFRRAGRLPVLRSLKVRAAGS